MDTVSEIIARSIGKLTEVRDDLLNGCRGKAGEDVDWDQYETLSQSAKEIDHIRHLLVERTELRHARDARTVHIRTRFPGGSYPRYLVRGDTLAKVGLSRSGSTYVHRVPREAAESVVSGLQEFTKDGDTFTTERAVNRIAVPMYQTYIVLAALAELHLLEPVRRGLFRFVDRGTFVEESKDIWKKFSQSLPSGGESGEI